MVDPRRSCCLVWRCLSLRWLRGREPRCEAARDRAGILRVGVSRETSDGCFTVSLRRQRCLAREPRSALRSQSPAPDWLGTRPHRWESWSNAAGSRDGGLGLHSQSAAPESTGQQAPQPLGVEECAAGSRDGVGLGLRSQSAAPKSTRQQAPIRWESWSCCCGFARRGIEASQAVSSARPTREHSASSVWRR
jgi:hypothetical protein